MIKVIPLEKWIKMSSKERKEEALRFAREFRGSGLRAIKRETLSEFLRRKFKEHA